MMHFKKLFIILVIIAISFAKDCPPVAPSDAQYALGWDTIAILITILSVIVSAIAFMFSKALDLRTLEQAAKTELVYAASTVFIVAFLIVFVTAGDSLLVDTSKNIYLSSLGIADAHDLRFCPDTGLTDIMIMYLDPSAACARTLGRTLYTVSLFVEPATTVYMEIFMSEHASGFGFKIISERIKNTTEMLMFYMFFYYIIIHILNFIKVYGLYILTMGIAMRAFPPTRGAGAYIMALALGLYFVFPFSYIVSSAILLPPVKPNFIGVNTVDNLAEQASDINYVCNLPSLTNVEYCGFTNPSKSFEADLWLKANRDKIDSITNVLSTSVISNIAVSICFLPFISLIILFTFVLSTTNLFGGNIPEVGRGLIKLI